MVNQTFHVLDESFEPRPVWVPGQLFIGGIGVAKGYWHDEEKTKAKFVTHPRTGERLYATGDLGRYLPSGDIEFLGREDFQVKIRGFRIELGEIEAAFRQHPSVRSVVVTAVGKTTAERSLLAYVIPQPEGDAGEPDAAAMTRLGLEATLLEFLATKLPEHMCPARVVLLDHLPLTPNGKVDLRSLPVPETMGASGETTLAAPRNDAEAALVDVWREVLHTEAVGIQDNFFDLGGDSVSAIQVVSRIVRRGYELSPVMLFRYPTVAELAVKLAPTTLTDSAVDEITI
jgi:aryl carrier-like protein